MAHQAHYHAYGIECIHIYIGGTPMSIKEAIIEYCPTAYFHSITPINTSEDEIKETHTLVDTDHHRIAINSPKHHEPVHRKNHHRAR